GGGISPDPARVVFFAGGLGPTGSTRGTGEYLKKTNPQMRNIGIVCQKSGFVPGIRNSDEMYEVGLFQRPFYDDVIEVTIDESIDAMLTLIRKCGVLSGPTGGASFAGTLRYLRSVDEQLTEKKNAVFLVCEDRK